MDYPDGYSDAIRYVRSDTTDAILRHLHADEEARAPGSPHRQVAADAFEEAGDPFTAAGLRSSDPIYFIPAANDDTNLLGKRLHNGTEYDLDTPEEVIHILENARHSGTRLHLRTGDLSGDEAGRDWLEDFGTEGRISRSTGTRPIPVLVHSDRSLGGFPILTGNIIRVLTATGKREIYRHPNYDHGVITLQPVDYGDLKFGVFRDGQNQRNFRTEAAARRWVKKLGLTLSE